MDPQEVSPTNTFSGTRIIAGRLAVRHVMQPAIPSDDGVDFMMPYARPKTPGMHPMVVLQPGERIVTELKRHPIGIISLYAAATVGIAVAAVLAMTLLPNAISGNMTVFAGGFALIALLVVLVLGVATSVYWQNQWVVTTDSITQITQRTLFDRRVSQLHMENLEDVTVFQEGFFARMLNYGTLRVETAGEHSRFTFPYCPNPNGSARKILEAHEYYLRGKRQA